MRHVLKIACLFIAPEIRRNRALGAQTSSVAEKSGPEILSSGSTHSLLTSRGGDMDTEPHLSQPAAQSTVTSLPSPKSTSALSGCHDTDSSSRPCTPGTSASREDCSPSSGTSNTTSGTSNASFDAVLGPSHVTSNSLDSNINLFDELHDPFLHNAPINFNTSMADNSGSMFNDTFQNPSFGHSVATQDGFSEQHSTYLMAQNVGTMSGFTTPETHFLSNYNLQHLDPVAQNQLVDVHLAHQIGTNTGIGNIVENHVPETQTALDGFADHFSQSEHQQYLPSSTASFSSAPVAVSNRLDAQWGTNYEVSNLSPFPSFSTPTHMPGSTEHTAELGTTKPPFNTSLSLFDGLTSISSWVPPKTLSEAAAGTASFTPAIGDPLSSTPAVVPIPLLGVPPRVASPLLPPALPLRPLASPPCPPASPPRPPASPQAPLTNLALPSTRSGRSVVPSKRIEQNASIGDSAVRIAAVSVIRKPIESSDPSTPPSWVSEAKHHLELSDLGPAWKCCVDAWFALESQLKFGTIAKSKVLFKPKHVNKIFAHLASLSFRVLYLEHAPHDQVNG